MQKIQPTLIAFDADVRVERAIYVEPTLRGSKVSILYSLLVLRTADFWIGG